MNQIHLYPLFFEPIYQYRLWGGRRLSNLLSLPLPGDDPIGEAWLLSDRDDYVSIIQNGSLKGKTFTQLFNSFQEELMGKMSGCFNRFPLLLKILDASVMLSVQVHPTDLQTKYLPEGERGKTEAWVVLETGQNSNIFAGLKPATTEDMLRQDINNGTAASHLANFKPKVGDGIFIKAGTVHTFGDAVVFEVQENSDVTFRLYDWDRIDIKTGKPRPLQVEKAMACIDYAQVNVGPVVPLVEELKPVLIEKLFICEHFELWRISGDSPFNIGKLGMPRIMVCLNGIGKIEYKGLDYPFIKGDVVLLPAIVGECLCQCTNNVTLLEISIPERVNF